MEEERAIPPENAGDREGGRDADKQATSAQLMITVFVLGLASSIFLQPIFLIHSAGRDAYIALAVHGGIDLVALVLTLVAMKLAGGRDFFSLLKGSFGEVGARIVSALFGLFFLYKVCIAAAETVSFYSDSVSADFDTTLMTVLLLVFFGAAACHTLRALCRLSQLLAPLIAVCLALLITIVAVTGFDLANIFPAMRDGAGFCDALIRHASWIGDFTPLALFIGRTQIKKHTALFTAASGTLAAAVAVFFAMVMCAAFGNVPELVDTGTNLATVLQYSIGNLYGRIDLVAVLLWSIASFIEGGLFFYSACRCLEFTIGRSAHFAVSAALAAAVFFTELFAMSDPTLFSAVTSDVWASSLTVAFTLAVPVLALVGTRVSAHDRPHDKHDRPQSKTEKRRGYEKAE